MSDDIVISVKDLTRTYRIKQAFILGRVKFHKEFTALKDISFEIKKVKPPALFGAMAQVKARCCGLEIPCRGRLEV